MHTSDVSYTDACYRFVLHPLRKVSADRARGAPSVSSVGHNTSVDMDTISLQDWHPADDSSPVNAAVAASGSHTASDHGEASTYLHALDCYKLAVAIDGPLQVLFTPALFEQLAGAFGRTPRYVRTCGA